MSSLVGRAGLIRPDIVARPRPRATLSRPPRQFETAIEAPYRLVISPSARAGWTHATEPVGAEGAPHRIELWHTRLGVRVEDDERVSVDERRNTQRVVRALWARDREGPELFEGALGGITFPNWQSLKWPGRVDKPFRSSLDPGDRHMLVRQSAETWLDAEQEADPAGARRRRGPVALRARRLARPARRMEHGSVLGERDPLDPALGPRRAARSRPVRAGRVPRLPLPVRPQDEPGQADRAQDEGRRAVGRRPVPAEVPRRRRAAPVVRPTQLPVRRAGRDTPRHPDARQRSGSEQPLHPAGQQRAVQLGLALRRQGAAARPARHASDLGSRRVSEPSRRRRPSTTRAASTRWPPTGRTSRTPRSRKAATPSSRPSSSTSTATPEQGEVRAAAHGRLGRAPGDSAAVADRPRDDRVQRHLPRERVPERARTWPRSGRSCRRRRSSRSARAPRPGATRRGASSSRTSRSPASPASRGRSATSPRSAKGKFRPEEFLGNASSEAVRPRLARRRARDGRRRPGRCARRRVGGARPDRGLRRRPRTGEEGGAGRGRRGQPARARERSRRRPSSSSRPSRPSRPRSSSRPPSPPRSTTSLTALAGLPGKTEAEITAALANPLQALRNATADMEQVAPQLPPLIREQLLGLAGILRQLADAADLIEDVFRFVNGLATGSVQAKFRLEWRPFSSPGARSATYHRKGSARAQEGQPRAGRRGARGKDEMRVDVLAELKDFALNLLPGEPSSSGSGSTTCRSTAARRASPTSTSSCRTSSSSGSSASSRRCAS